jgi:hypothetical protein
MTALWFHYLPVASCCNLPLQVVTVTGTTTSGKPLSEENLAKVMDGCAMAMALDEDKRLVSEWRVREWM